MGWVVKQASPPPPEPDPSWQFKGSLGGSGGGGPAGFRYEQNTPAASWIMQHNLGRRVEPTIFVDGELGRPSWTDLEFPDANTTVAIFEKPVTGFAEF